MQMGKTFLTLWCEQHGGTATEFERRLFWRCLNRHALPLAFFLIRLKPETFREDFEMLRDIKSSTNTDEVVGELNRFYGRNLRDNGFFRRRLLVRVSGSRLLTLWRDLKRADGSTDD